MGVISQLQACMAVGATRGHAPQQGPSVHAGLLQWCEGEVACVGDVTKLEVAAAPVPVPLRALSRTCGALVRSSSKKACSL